jgi:hypothetical protein
VLQWHVVGMFAPGFFTGHVIKRFGALPVMARVSRSTGLHRDRTVGRGTAPVHHCAVPARTRLELLFTGATTLSLSTYAPEEKDRAQAVLNFFIFATLAFTSSLRACW